MAEWHAVATTPELVQSIAHFAGDTATFFSYLVALQPSNALGDFELFLHLWRVGNKSKRLLRCQLWPELHLHWIDDIVAPLIRRVAPLVGTVHTHEVYDLAALARCVPAKHPIAIHDCPHKIDISTSLAEWYAALRPFNLVHVGATRGWSHHGAQVIEWLRPFSSLRSLILHELDDASMERVVGFVTSSSIAHLSLGACFRAHITNAIARALTRWLTSGNSVSLRLHQWVFCGDKITMHALYHAMFTAPLEELHLIASELYHVSSFRLNRSIQPASACIECCGLNNTALATIFSGLKGASTTSFSLNGPMCTPSLIEYLGDALRHSRLRKLHLSTPMVASACSAMLAKALSNGTSLRELYLTGMNICDVHPLTLVIPSILSLRILDLSDNPIDLEGASQLIETTKTCCPGIEMLRLNHINIHKHDVDTLQRSIDNRTHSISSNGFLDMLERLRADMLIDIKHEAISESACI
ncbi:hypothetical protein AC1031_007532 [Aphanomyces cochlioides]|nr:hypothetical protein AC1031_007532 [Aphanomyces cochlioides]